MSHGVYLEDERITDHELKEPFARLHAIQTTRQAASTPQGVEPQNATRALPGTGKHWPFSFCAYATRVCQERPRITRGAVGEVEASPLWIRKEVTCES
jgi:hypothetical protein